MKTSDEKEEDNGTGLPHTVVDQEILG